MHYKRVIPCLDVDGGRVVKGVEFVDIRDAGDPIELAAHYDREGADELVFLDITATHEKRETIAQLARRTADEVFIPFTIGGGVRSVADAQAVLDAGADKVSVNSAALQRPELLDELAEVFGAQCVVLAIDAKARAEDEGWEAFLAGGRTATGRDAVAWAAEGVERGAGEILLTSMDRDGTSDGYDLPLTSAVSEAVGVPVIASGERASSSTSPKRSARAPTRCSAPRSSTTAVTASPRRRPTSQRRGSPCAPTEEPGLSPTHPIQSVEHALERLAGLPGGPELLRLARERGDLALVGGAVRDLLLGHWPRELDVSVERNAAGLATEIAASVPASERAYGHAVVPVLHERFGTATVAWEYGRIDIAERRAEVYPAPGELPEVRPGSVEEDLARRDFTVNAIALALGGGERGVLRHVDGALEDLAAGVLRVLHERSFLEDPTRILRLARYAARLRFEIEPRTRELAAQAVARGALDTLSGARIGAELWLALGEDTARSALRALDALGVLAALGMPSPFDEELAEQAAVQLPREGSARVLLDGRRDPSGRPARRGRARAASCPPDGTRLPRGGPRARAAHRDRLHTRALRAPSTRELGAPCRDGSRADRDARCARRARIARGGSAPRGLARGAAPREARDRRRGAARRGRRGGSGGGGPPARGVAPEARRTHRRKGGGDEGGARRPRCSSRHGAGRVSAPELSASLPGGGVLFTERADGNMSTVAGRPCGRGEPGPLARAARTRGHRPRLPGPRNARATSPRREQKGARRRSSSRPTDRPPQRARSG